MSAFTEKAYTEYSLNIQKNGKNIKKVIRKFIIEIKLLLKLLMIKKMN